jgi:hypothetical protein
LILFVIMSCCSLIVYTRSNAYKKEDQFQWERKLSLVR